MKISGETYAVTYLISLGVTVGGLCLVPLSITPWVGIVSMFVSGIGMESTK